MNDDKSGIHSVLEQIDRRTESELFRRAGERFGFPTAEACGLRVAFRPHLAAAFGYKDESGIRKLVERYDLECYYMGGYSQSIRTLLIETLGLDKSSGRGSFVTWQAFLVAGMVSNAPAADEIKLYLLKTEKATRVAAGTLSLAKGHSRLDSAAKVISLISRSERIKDAHLRNFALKHIDEALDGALMPPDQMNLFK